MEVLMILKRIGALSLAKVMGVIYAILGLFVGIIIAIAVSLGALAGSMISESSQAWIGLVFGLGSVIFFPIFYGFLGFLGGLIVAGLYNWIERLIGGIELEFEPMPAQKMAASAQATGTMNP
jgi:hypothetical protein